MSVQMPPPRVVALDEIMAALEAYDPLASMETAFRTYSQGGAIVPPAPEAILPLPAGLPHATLGSVQRGDHHRRTIS
jgi:hypothetical protein